VGHTDLQTWHIQVSAKHEVDPVHIIRPYEVMEVQLHRFLTSARDAGETRQSHVSEMIVASVDYDWYA
jgi:hypothetical protein